MAVTMMMRKVAGVELLLLLPVTIILASCCLVAVEARRHGHRPSWPMSNGMRGSMNAEQIENVTNFDELPFNQRNGDGQVGRQNTGFGPTQGKSQGAVDQLSSWIGQNGGRMPSRFDVGMTKRQFKRAMKKWLARHGGLKKTFNGRNMPQLLGGLKKTKDGGLMQQFKKFKGKKMKMLMEPDSDEWNGGGGRHKHRNGRHHHQIVLYINGKRIDDPKVVKRMMKRLGLDAGKMLLPMMAGGVMPTELPPHMVPGFVEEVMQHMGHIPGLGPAKLGDNYGVTVSGHGGGGMGPMGPPGGGMMLMGGGGGIVGGFPPGPPPPYSP